MVKYVLESTASGARSALMKKEDTMAKIFASPSKEVSDRELRNGARVRALAPQGMVLLENNGVLPLAGAPGKIALYGSGARRTVKGGTGSGDVNSREVVNVEQGLEAAGYTIVTKDWIDRDCAHEEALRAEYMAVVRQKFAEMGFAAIGFLFDNPFQPPCIIPVEEADLKPAEADTALVVIARNSGEGKDRRDVAGEYELFPEEIAALEKIAAAYVHTVVVLNVGSVIDMKAIKAVQGIDAILLMSQAGNYGGYALADVLTGRAEPSGRLTTTWGVNYADYPAADTFSHRNGNLDDEYYSEGIYVGYRYFDSFNITPQYPFGYGLSYTSFDVETLDVRADERQVRVSVRVTNTGARPGREVVQVYYSAPAGELEKPWQELAGFAKSKELAPGASEVLEICFATKSMASYSVARAAWVLEPGVYVIRVGVHSRSTRVAAVLSLDALVITEQLKNLLTPSQPLNLLSRHGVTPYSDPEEPAQLALAKRIPLKAAAFETITAVYSGPAPELPKTDKAWTITLDDVRSGKATLEELVSQLTPLEMATLCVGTDRRETGGAQIGASSAACPGAAGDTTSLLIDSRKVRNLILPDGPAGLRLTPSFKTDAAGNVLPGGNAFAGLDFLDEFFPKAEIPADAKTWYQYATAIPIATMLAQTWDLAAIEEAGDIVGGEMEEFGCDLWLAPGMNIHRNPLCGRNFEYYSEDPLVAGLAAAADTRGVHRHVSASTTIKHFAFNNQEDNRQHVNSVIDERAIREIYLKGFEIAVKESQPKSIMTSYNLINGEHTANSYPLNTAIARDEWGFRGFVMTDWGTTGSSHRVEPKTKYGCSFASGCVKAGNDLTMPGSQRDVDDILNALGKKEGEVPYPLTLGELQSCALHILRVILEMER